MENLQSFEILKKKKMAWWRMWTRISHCWSAEKTFKRFILKRMKKKNNEIIAFATIHFHLFLMRLLLLSLLLLD